ncbi:M23 family peptidase [Duganella sp. BJB488]|uniref:M23 family metallopeptidase n=1 Tax=unclassified Duganella TaxID=2636909 RepID=UPI000E3421CB|nr:MULTISPECIES: M23 family metallopeptidase [unclassified Duganella]RFP26134.1 M23 family peptidase [Duganella sp. BJB489]RFP28128.1 M23 family peptidase [Duganella sp. BJB488]RFP37062.1 M23 family peptidase [Duganella sp. BJB480]
MSIGSFSGISAVGLCAMTALSVHAQALPSGCDSVGSGAGTVSSEGAPAPVFPPIQLEIRTPLAPTLFAGGGRSFLLYELHLHNFSDQALPLRGIEVINADNGAVLDLIKEPQLKERVRLAGGDDDGGVPRLAAGQGAVAFLCLAFDTAAVPRTLRHRVLLDNAFADSASIGTRANKMHVLGPPLAGANWTADNGPSIQSHHRIGVFVAGGLAYNARRYAIDWKKYLAGATFGGDARDVHAHFAYGQDVLAVADGRIVAARNDMPDNIPRTKDGFTPAVAITMDNIAGNFIVLDLGDGQFAQYAHLQPGSVRVKTGDRVRRGQLIAHVGNSGDARVPHLHFQVANAPDFLASEGLPYLIDHFKLKTAEGVWQTRKREFPLDASVVDFGAEGNRPTK